jgi:NAD+ diphosphatase
LADAWSRGSILVVDTDGAGRALVRETDGGDAELVLVAAAAAPVSEPSQRLFLGVDADDAPIFAVVAPLPEVLGARAANLREVGDRLSDRDAGILTTAVALVNWHARHLYSPTSGQPTTVTDGGWVRVDENGRQMWPRTDPAIIVLVHDGVPGPAGRTLLGHNAAWAGTRWAGRMFSCLAGFVEPGESAEAAVAREVGEEVGVDVSRIEYLGSQSWPFPGSLMLGFLAYADPAQPVHVDPEEITEARWFSRREVAAILAGEEVAASNGGAVSLPSAASIALYLVKTWLKDERSAGTRVDSVGPELTAAGD